MGSNEKPLDERHADKRDAAWAEGLRARYDSVAQEPLPERFEELLERLDDAEQRYR